MASTPDSNPDSPPPEQSDDVEKVSTPPGSRDLEDSPGTDGGTSGTGGTNHRTDRDITS